MKETNPLVSVIIPAYNAASFLTIAVESVLNQTYTNIEIVIVDDGSTDSTFAIAQGLAAKHTNVKAITQVNAKQGKARNNGIENSTGMLLAFLDADDEWLPHKIDTQLTYLKKFQADLVFTNGYLFITDSKLSLQELSKTTPLAIDMEALKGIIQGNNGIKLLHRKNRIPTSSVLCKRSAVINAGLFTTKLPLQNCEDYLLWLTLVKQGCRLIGVPDKLFLYRVHPNSSTNGIRNQLFPLIKSIYEMQLPLSIQQSIQLAGHSRALFEELYAAQELQLAKPLMEKYATFVASGFSKIILTSLLKSNLLRIYLSIFMRHSAKVIKLDKDDSHLIGAL